MNTCCHCALTSVKTVIDFNRQPISTRFLMSKSIEEYTYPFKLGICQICALVQLIEPPAEEQLHPTYDWIHYNEPEGHLDDLVEIVMNLPDVNANSTFLGLSHFEDSTLDRLNKKQYLNVSRLIIDKKYKQCNTLSVIGTVQHYLEHKNIEKITQFNKKPSVIIVRDTLEHAHQPMMFLNALRSMVDESGYVVFEVPDYQKNFDSYDYSALWEEHISYFTPHTFLRCLNTARFEVKVFKQYEYDLQDYLVAIVKPFPTNAIVNDCYPILNSENTMLEQYASSYKQLRSHFKDVLLGHRKKGKIAMFGAGHLSCHFINLMDLSDLIDFVIDDHPKKCGMYMPGSKLPIVSSLSLREVRLCLLGLSQESEKKVIQKHADFVDKGGIFASIFPTSRFKLT